MQNKTGSPLDGRPLPSNPDAERALLGAIIINNESLAAVMEHLKPADFFLEENKRIYAAILKLHSISRGIDLITLIGILTESNELGFAGGAGYVSSLIDGVPRNLNPNHYADLITEKSHLRSIIFASTAAINRALEGHAKPEDLKLDIEQSLQYATANGNGRPKLVAVELDEFLMMNLRPIEWVIKQIFPTQGLGMLYAARGTGKTWAVMEIAHQIATGGPNLWGWQVEKARPVCIVDGEMQANRLQDRYRKLVSLTKLPSKKFLRIISPDLQDPEFGGDRKVLEHFNIETRYGQQLIEDHLEDNSFLILDNLSCLCRAGKENEGESWLPILSWALSLRRRGVSVLFIHHAGKSGDQRGSGRKEDALDVIIEMRKPDNYEPTELMRAEIWPKKTRGSEDAGAVTPFELKMENDERGKAYWTYKPLREAVETRVLISLTKYGMKVGEIAAEIPGTDRFKIYRIIDKLKERGQLPMNFQPGKASIV